MITEVEPFFLHSNNNNELEKVNKNRKIIMKVNIY